MKLADVANLILTCYRFTLRHWPDVRDLRAFIKENRGTSKLERTMPSIFLKATFEEKHCYQSKLRTHDEN